MSTDLTKVQAKPGTLSEFLGAHKGLMKSALQDAMTPERLIQIARVAVTQTPGLQECGVLDVAASVMQCAVLGLEPNTPLGEAYLIPYWNGKLKRKVCQFQTGYQGLVKLAYRSGEFKLITAMEVCEQDDFDFEKGLNPWIRHKPPKRGERGEIYGYWGGFLLTGGAGDYVYMTVEEINEHRDRYSQGAYNKAGELQGPWRDSPEWMYKKTPLKKSLKLAPKSIIDRRIAMATAIEDYHSAGVPLIYPDVPLELQPAHEDSEEIPMPTARVEGGK